MRKALVMAAGFALGWACSDTTGPQDNLMIMDGPRSSDTVGSVLTPALTVRLLRRDGQPHTGQTVYFSTGGPVLVAYTPNAGLGINRLPVTTDAYGYASAFVEMKYSQGAGTVTVSANGAEIQAHYIVLPGAPTFVRADPIDTAMYVGATETLRPYMTDDYGNRRSDTPVYAYASLNSAASVTGAGVATAESIGRAVVTIRALGFVDTVHASVVPHGRVAAQYQGLGDPGAGYMVVTNLDGSGFDTIPGSFALNWRLDWSPLGDTLVLYRSTPAYLASVDMRTGTSRRVVTDSLIITASYPSYSRDGSYIYFTGFDSLTHCYGVWRVHPSGGGLERTVADTSDCGSYQWQVAPSPDDASSASPDGTQIVYVGHTLRMRTLATGADTSLGVVGDAPRWSPTGDWIAYDSLGTLMLIHPDGTGHRVLFDRGADGYLPGVAWSPDGQWLIFRGYDRLVLVNVATGLQLPLSVSRGLAEPTWRP